MRIDSEWMAGYLEGAPSLDEQATRLTACGLLVETREPSGGSEVWDVDVTTNRPDAMNHYGLAREVAVATGARLRPLVVELDESDEPVEELAAIEIADPERCSRFVARVIRGVRVVASPPWLAERLERCGVRPINAIVDATNYVLLATGQPLHAYDLDQVHGRRLVARGAQPGETLVTLDGETRTLDPSMLVIADDAGVVGIAGVMGGASSEISVATSDVLLEGANFDALSVRRTARRLGMHTEASHRFERGADPEMAPRAVDLAASLIAELTGGRVCRGRIDVNPRPAPVREVSFERSRLVAFAGLEMAIERVRGLLAGLGFEPRIEGDTVCCRVPSWRVDIDRTADLYEEVIRHVGYDAVPSRLPVAATPPGRRHPNWELVDRGRRAALGAGLAEIVTYSFIATEADSLAEDSPLTGGTPVELANPLAATQAVMRRSLLPGMLTAARDNLNHGEERLAVFEQGRAFWIDGEGRPVEQERIAVALSGSALSWLDSQPADFPLLKGVVAEILDRAGFPGVEWRRGGAPWLDEAEGAELLDARSRSVIGVAGAVSKSVAARWDLRQRVYVAELDLTTATEPPMPSFEPLPRYPPVAADITVEHPESLTWSELLTAARALAADTVREIQLLDRYQGQGVVGGQVRTTMRCVYRHVERSLTQEEVNADQERLRAAMAAKLGVRFA